MYFRCNEALIYFKQAMHNYFRARLLIDSTALVVKLSDVSYRCITLNGVGTENCNSMLWIC